MIDGCSRLETAVVIVAEREEQQHQQRHDQPHEFYHRESSRYRARMLGSRENVRNFRWVTHGDVQ